MDTVIPRSTASKLARLNSPPIGLPAHRGMRPGETQVSGGGAKGTQSSFSPGPRSIEQDSKRGTLRRPPILPRFMHKRGVFCASTGHGSAGAWHNPPPLASFSRTGGCPPLPSSRMRAGTQAVRQTPLHPFAWGAHAEMPPFYLLPPCPCDWAAQNPGSGLRTEGAQVKWHPSRTSREHDPRTSRVHDLRRHLSRATRASSHFAGNAAELSREDLLSPRVYLRRTARWLIYKN